MAAGKSGGSSGEITFLEGTSMSALAGGWGVGMKIQENVLPSSPDIRLFTLGSLGAVEVPGGGGCRGDGGEGARWVGVHRSWELGRERGRLRRSGCIGLRAGVGGWPSRVLA